MATRKDLDTLNAGLPEIQRSPDANGTLEYDRSPSGSR